MMVGVIHICLFALLLTIDSGCAYNEEHESALRARKSSTNHRPVYQRAKRRRGLKSSESSSSKGGSNPSPVPNPVPGPTPVPTPGPTPPPTNVPTPPPTPPAQTPTASPTRMATANPTESPSSRPSAAPSVADTFVSYVRLEVQTAGGSEPDQAALDALAGLTRDTYNAETEKCADPFGRKMIVSEFFSVSSSADGRRMKNRRRSKAIIKGAPSERNLQALNIFVFLKVSGKCNGCPNNKFFFNQVVGRRRSLQTCTTVPADAFLDSMTTNLMTGDYGPIEQAISIADVSEPSVSGSKKEKKSKKESMSSESDDDDDDDYDYDDDDHDDDDD